MINKHKFFITTILSSTIVLAAVIASTSMNGVFAKQNNNDPSTCEHDGFHYLEKSPTYNHDGNDEFWSCCYCHSTFTSEPEKGTWIIGDEMEGGIPLQFTRPAYKTYDEAFELLELPSLENPTIAEKAQAVLVSSDFIKSYESLPDSAQRQLHHRTDIQHIKCYGYVVYGDNEGDTITAYDGASSVSSINVIDNDLYGDVYKVNILTNETTLNATFTLDNLLSESEAIATDAKKLVLFAANNATIWGTSRDLCNIAKFNNDYATIGSTQLDTNANWGMISVDLLANEGLTPNFACYGFKEEWNGLKPQGSLYFSRLVALTDTPYIDDQLAYDVMEMIDALPSKEDLLSSEDIDFAVISNIYNFNEAKTAYDNLNPTLKPIVSNYQKLLDLTEIFDMYTQVVNGYVPSDGDGAITLVSEVESDDISHGLCYDLTLRPIEDVANKVMGVKMSTPLEYSNDYTKYFMYVYNPGNDYGLVFGDNIWGKNIKVSPTTCVGGEWTKIEITEEFAATLNYVTYRDWAPPTELIGWKFTPVYGTEMNVDIYKGNAFENKIKNLPLSYDVDTSSLINEEMLYQAQSLQEEYDELSDESKACVISYDKVLQISDIFDEKYTNIYDCNNYFENETYDVDPLYGLAMKQVTGPDNVHFGKLPKAAFSNFDFVKIVVYNYTEATLSIFGQDDSSWGSVFNATLAPGEIKEITILSDNIPSAANNIYLYSNAGLRVSSCFGSIDTTYTDFH